MQKLLTIILFISGMFANSTSINHFQFESQSNGSGILNLNLGELEFDSHGDYKKLNIEHTGQILEVGMPDLPTFSTLYMVDKNVQYDVQYEIMDSYIIENINLLPYIEDDEKKQVYVKNRLNDISYSQITSYPTNHLNVSETQTMRDIDIISVEFIPFTFYSEEKKLEIYNNVNITITPLTEASISETIKYSRPFVKMYESLVSNFIRTENMEFQQPAILVIGGGNSLTNNDVEDLLEWRHKRGYVVYTASTSQTGTSTNSIKNYIQNAYEDFEPKPEFITLMGDVGGSYNVPTFTESWSGYSGKGDNPYGLISGDDLYPDVIIGRISAGNSDDIATVVNKILHYEKATYIEQTGTDWYEGAALAGDPSSSGVSTIITNMFINDILDEYGFEDVNTQYNNGWSSFMSNELNEGVLFLNYRGYIGVSGFGSGNINNLNNGFMLPFATVLTCGTGNFADDWGGGESLSEDFFEAGSANIPKGAIASVGTATSGTHTMYNNVVAMGMYWGLFPGGAQTAGESLVHGKLHLIKTYPNNSGNFVNIFSHWNNLMGDPATHLWTGTPQEIMVNYNSNLSLGSNFIDVSVADINNNPVEDAWVTLLMGNDIIFTSKMTDASGDAFFHIENIPEGNISVTVTKQNRIPHEGTISVNDVILPVNVVFTNISIDDDSMTPFVTGNNDGLLNPGEIINLLVPVKNFGSYSVSNLTVELTADSDMVTFEGDDAMTDIASLAANEEVTLQFMLSLDASAIDGEELGIRIRISDTDINEAYGYLPINVVAGRLIVNGYSFEEGGIIHPGETKNMQIELKNIGNIGVDFINGEFTVEGNLFTINDNNLTWNSINTNSSVFSWNSIEITAHENIINGTVIPVQLYLTSANGYNHIEPMHIQVGTVTITDPLGPDQHGYYIYDSGDLGYNLAAIYDWIEIDPDYGGLGTSLDLSDPGNGGNTNTYNSMLSMSETVDLPFDFSFYGIEYSQITISSNGWITFGESESASFRNYPVPGGGGPSPMIAAFWDDLITSNNGDVYTYYDQSMDAFIIEWSDMKNYSGNDDQDFELILFNTLTPTGDGEIKIQYKTFNNTSTGAGGGWAPAHGGYATIGTENHFGNVGLQYSFHNQYPEAALPLSDETALFITTRPSTPLTMGDVNQDTIINIVDVILIVNQILNPDGNVLNATETYVADINLDGVLNVFDIIIIINIILG